MDNQKIGKFIAEMRKANQMTQKDLASKLNITDKAVSKWERGLSCPDIALLSDLASILGITTSELLNGEKSSIDVSENIKETVDNALHYAKNSAQDRITSFQSIFSLSFSVLLFIGIIVCAICDLAISGSFTWSLFPISAILFAWLVLFPIVKFGRKGISGSLVSLSIFIIPFMYVLQILIQYSTLFFPIAIRISAISIVFLWCIFIVFKLLKERKLLASSISLLLGIPLCLVINATLSELISEKLFDVWDVITFTILIIMAGVLFSIERVRYRAK